MTRCRNRSISQKVSGDTFIWLPERVKLCTDTRRIPRREVKIMAKRWLDATNGTVDESDDKDLRRFTRRGEEKREITQKEETDLKRITFTSSHSSSSHWFFRRIRIRSINPLHDRTSFDDRKNSE